MMRYRDRILFILQGPALVLAMTIAGCGGYSTERPFPSDIQSIHVEMMHSKDFRRELEFGLTEAIVKRIEMDTPYNVARREFADSALSGEILEVQQSTLGTDFDTDLPRETAATVVLSWRWKDLRSGRIIREKPRHLYTASYIAPVGETFETGMTRALDGIAEQVVESMENGW